LKTSTNESVKTNNSTATEVPLTSAVIPKSPTN
jgi:hypothetical protein